MSEARGRIIEVRVHPRSSRRELVVKGGEIHIYTREKPEKGHANLDAVRIVSEYFKVPKISVELLCGGRARVKRFRIAADSETHKGRG